MFTAARRPLTAGSLCLLVCCCAHAAPTGHLAYLKANAAWVEPAAGGEAVKLPNSDGAQLVSLAPNGGMAVYAVPSADAAADDHDRYRCLLSKAPYQSAEALPAPLNRTYPQLFTWSADGATLFVSVPEGTVVCRPAEGSTQRLNFSVQSASSDGAVLLYQSDKEIRARWARTGNDQRLFSIGQPQPLFDALDNARRKDKLGDLLQSIEPELWHDQANWSVGPPAVAPDGQAAYFTCNAGTTSGAAGNCTFAWFMVNLATGKLSVLSTLGSSFGRVWGTLAVSPDGTHLLSEISIHDSAVRNPVSLHVIDLRSQVEHEVLWAAEQDRLHDEAADWVNLTDGVQWSPDGRYVAASTYFYSATKLLQGDDIKDPTPDDFELRLVDAATGAVVRVIEDALRPSWSS